MILRGSPGSYDALGREIKSIKTINGIDNFQVEKKYDAIGRIIQLTYPDGEKIDYTYSKQGIEEISASDTLSLSFHLKIIYHKPNPDKLYKKHNLHSNQPNISTRIRQ